MPARNDAGPGICSAWCIASLPSSTPSRLQYAAASAHTSLSCRSAGCHGCGPPFVSSPIPWPEAQIRPILCSRKKGMYSSSESSNSRRQRFVQHNVQVGRKLDVVNLDHIEVVEPEQLQASLDALARLLRTVVEHPVVLALVTAHFCGHVGDLLQEGGPQLLQVRQMLTVPDVQQRGERGIAVLMLQLTMLFCTCMYLPNSITWLVAATPYRSGWYVQCLFSSISMHVNPSVKIVRLNVRVNDLAAVQVVDDRQYLCAQYHGDEFVHVAVRRAVHQIAHIQNVAVAGRILPQRLHLVHHQARGQLGDVAEKVNPLEERFQQRPLERIDIVQHQMGVDLLHRPIHIDRFVLILVALLIV
uniref:Uncharacterized protein n=1 Tax=Anopheles melas TaxID=34690 RepID=A0A182U0Z9_9DIPT